MQLSCDIGVNCGGCALATLTHRPPHTDSGPLTELPRSASLCSGCVIDQHSRASDAKRKYGTISTLTRVYFRSEPIALTQHLVLKRIHLAARAQPFHT